MEKVTKRTFAPWPRFEEDEIEAAVRVLSSGKVNYWTGEEGRLFEKEFAAFAGCEYAVAVANGSVALELALYALGIGEGDEVVVTSRTFVASASSVVLRGAKPVFADVDADSGNITAETVRSVLTPRTKAIIAVHLGGWPCEMDEIMDLAHERGLWVIEDCAQAHGATYKGRPVGSLGHVAAWSFCQDKIMTTGGEGGMLTTNDHTLWERAWSYKDHGKSYEAVYHRQHPPGFRWLHESFGTNWRMTEMQSAIGRVALRKVPRWVAIRRRHAQILTERFLQTPGLRVTVPPEHIEHAYYRYYVFVRPEMLKPDWSRDRIMVELNQQGIPCNVGSCSEVYLEKSFERAKLQPLQRLPIAKRLGETSLAFLVHPTLSEEDMQDIAGAVAKVMHKACR
ncbi:MAG: pilin glycosylation aminotransferase PglC [Armatimonadota bacterium]|nr:MAG: pilin glycosylation aminotransferase PglC [Armatimonadota bacterium]